MYLFRFVESGCIFNALKMSFNFYDALDLWSLDLERLDFIGLFLARYLYF